MTLSLPIKEYVNIYKKWVQSNPSSASEAEMAIKWLSYFFAGRIDHSIFSTEMFYTMTNLLVFTNDRILESAMPRTPSPGDKLRAYLTVLEYCEVFIELTAKKKWGEKGKWIVIATIQAVKCLARLALLFKYKVRLLSSPAIPVLKRFDSSTPMPEVSSVAFTLKRSGRVIRKVDAAPSIGIRLWTPPTVKDTNDGFKEEEEENELRLRLAAEVLYIIRPLAQLATSYKFGLKSWKPWLLSLAIDVTSLQVLSSKRAKLSESEQSELSRRTFLLILYLLRSPFYERNTADRLTAFLNSLSRTLPLARFVAGPLQTCIPLWQAVYSYTWST